MGGGGVSWKKINKSESCTGNDTPSLTPACVDQGNLEADMYL